ncbi:CAIB/BAIF family enzyme [Calocera viscosa TUFC12733]|uniref:CAIB/BAIF family enzyme n=1 Tax=Calocera viscosa (strain TUFC12733) TaxID=1330018 RepID=A0A167HAU6_CALVF|nr:CAIB/BAIF family enzyme [Calocera viscosa TUFC12733]
MASPFWPILRRAASAPHPPARLASAWLSVRYHGGAFQRWLATDNKDQRGGIPPPLKGIRILDFTTALAGPSCTMYLADLGADVIKVEVPGKGDDCRSWGPPFVDHKDGVQVWDSTRPKRESAYFLAVNRNKKSITLNLKNKEAVDIALKLAADADIFIENQIAGKMEKLGLGYETVKAVKPDIIYCSITGYGQTGPYRRTPGYDAVVGGEAGIVHATGERDRPPVRPGIPVTDILTGFNATIALSAALLSRQKTGEGLYVDVSMFDCQVAAMTNLASAWLNGGVEAIRVGTGHTNVAPYQVFPTADGYIMIGIGNDVQFKRLADVMGQPDWPTSELYRTNSERLANKFALVDAMTEILLTHTTAQWTEKFWDKGFPFGSVNNMQQVFAHPQTAARDLVAEVPHPLIGTAKVVRPAIVYNGERMKVRTASPGLGQNTRELLNGLGIDDAQVDELKLKGAI